MWQRERLVLKSKKILPVAQGHTCNDVNRLWSILFDPNIHLTRVETNSHFIMNPY